MPKYHVQQSIRIDASVDKVRAAIEDFSEWSHWSPWLCMEPSAKVTVSGTPGKPSHNYHWEGDLVGSGSMTLTANDGKLLLMDLEFLKPFKSSAKVAMQLRRISDNQTEVVWSMDSQVPFFLFFLAGMIKVMIGRDFERGLKMLKEYTETGDVASRTEVVGIVDMPQSYFVGKEDECSMSEIGPSMEQAFCDLHQSCHTEGIPIEGPPGALYGKVDLKRNHCRYTAFMSVPSGTQLTGATSGTVGGYKALKVVHTGSYRHLGNAWGTAMTYQRCKKLKPLRSQFPFELYRSDPEQTPEKEIVTEIYVPLRS
jgi:effector-binding domain-containing protein